MRDTKDLSSDSDSATVAEARPMPGSAFDPDIEKIATAEADVDREAADLEKETAPGPRPLSTPAPAPASAIPDGGFDAWMQVAGSWAILFNTWGIVNSFGVFQTYYETELLKGNTSSQISWIGSLQAALLMILGIVAGPLFDAGYFRHLVIAGSGLVVFGMFMTSLCTQYWQVILAQGVCVGCGCGIVFLPSAAIMSQYFRRRRALVLGISSTGSPLAGIVLPIIFSRMQPRLGFGWATRIIAFILLGISVFPAIFMHTRIPPSGKKRSLIDRSALRDVPFVLFATGAFFSFLCLYVAFFYLQLFTVSERLSSVSFSPYLVTLLNAGSIVGRVLPNFVADRVGSMNMIFLCALVSAVLAFGWLGVRNLAGDIVFALLYGGFSGGVVSLTPSVVATLAPDLGRIGVRMGMLMFVAGLSLVAGTPIAGAILGGETDPDWTGMIVYAAVGLLVGATAFAGALMVLRMRKGGWRH